MSEKKQETTSETAEEQPQTNNPVTPAQTESGENFKNLTELLQTLVPAGVSDVHLHVGSPPIARIDGDLQRIGIKPLTPEHMRHIVQNLVTQEQWREFNEKCELDFAYGLAGIGRFRCNMFKQRGSVGIVMRVIQNQIPNFEKLGLPVATVREMLKHSRGLILITGPTGSGKTTTLASMIDEINRNYSYNIITIEDPIEFLHRNKESLVIQREVGADTSDFKTALKFALRQDPDVILIGEMRDRETVEAALTAAQTGHLVFSTLHTNDAIGTINRIIDLFQPHEREQVRIQLSEVLVGTFSQRLARHIKGEGRVLVHEILVNTPLIKDFIRDEEKTAQVKDAIAENNLHGMITFDQHLALLYSQRQITLEEAASNATSAHELKLMVTTGKYKKF